MNRLLAILIALIPLIISRAGAETKAIAEWTFDTPGDTMGWTAGSEVEGLAVRDGSLSGKTVARDPLIHGPMIDIPAKPNQYVEIRMKSSADGNGELYWANTTEPPYEGFRPEQLYQIKFKAGDFRVYRVFPFWQQEKKIIRLRLDPPENAEFAVDYIKVFEIVSPETDRTYFDFTKRDQTWASTVGSLLVSSADQGTLVKSDEQVLLVSPGLDIDAVDYPWLSVSGRSYEVDRLVIQWVTDDLPGIRSCTIRLKPDGIDHVYNIATDTIPDWSGRVKMLALSVPPTGRGAVTIHSAGASDKPMGPAEFDIRQFGPRDPINRTGRDVIVQATVINTGGETARGVKVVLHTPASWGFASVGHIYPSRRAAGAPVLDKVVRTIPELKPGESEIVTWTVGARGVGEFKASVDALAPAVPRTHADATFRWYPAVNLPKSPYVPEPKPVRGEFEVGMYYFPGWPNYTKWSVLNDYPERRPILGYYREGDPEVADWQIKWMVEHGVTFIVYDWYWSAGGRMLEHGIHQGFFNAKYHDKIKFCLLWANHNADGTSSAEDMVNVTTFWLDNYFLRDDYMKVDGKPVVVIFSPYRLTKDMGVDGTKAAFEKSRAMAKARGLNGIYFVGCTWPGPGQLSPMEAEGYDAATGYNYPSAGDKGQIVAPYADMVTGFKDIWNAIQDSTSLPYIPVSEPGWDARPWHGPNTRMRTGKTPELFRQMLLNSREFVEKRKIAGPKMVLIEAWNEFGEGDYVEPHQEWGFGHVDAIREVFTNAPKDHIDLVPQDVGLGPYELEKPVPATAWEFDDPSLPGWDAAQGLGDVKVQNGCLTATSSGNDPAFASQVIDIDAATMRSIEIRMKVDQGNGAQLFWSIRGAGLSEAASMSFKSTADGEFHVYKLDLGSSPTWKGRVTSFRLDPTDLGGAHIEVDYIRLLP